MAEIKDGGLIEEIKDFFIRQAELTGQRSQRKSQLFTTGYEELTPTPAQAAWIAAQLDPTMMTGLVDAGFGYPSFPAANVPLEEAFSGELMPSFTENVREGDLGIAALQGLGLIPGIGSIIRSTRAAKNVARAYDPIEGGIAGLARHQRTSRYISPEDYLASQQPSKKIKKKPKEHPTKQLRSQIREKRQIRSENRNFPIVGRNLQQRLESFKLEGIANDIATNHPNRQYWYKPDREQIFQAVRMNYSPAFSLRRANLKGLVRKFKNEGWSVDHVSKTQGRVSSYYVKKGDNTLRISDHDLPMTAEREYHRSRGLSGFWDDEIVVSSQTNIEQEYRSVLDGLELR